MVVSNFILVSNSVQVSEFYTGKTFLTAQKQAHAHVYVTRGICNTQAAN